MNAHLVDRRTLLTGFAAIAATPSVTWAASPAWSQAEPMPYAVQEIYPVGVGQRIFVAGGIANLGDSRDGITLTQIYDASSDSWSIGPDLPERRHHNMLVTVEDAVYSIGGYRGSPPRGVWEMKPAIWLLDPEDWRPAAVQPEPQAEQVSLVIDGRVHSIGGRSLAGEANASRDDHADVATHWVWDVSTGVWDKAAPASVARNSAAGAVIDGLLYVAGGREEFALTGLTEVYDPTEDRWRRVASMPQGQAGLAAAAVGGRLYAFGGEAVFTDNDRVFAEVWVYESDADRWTALPPLPTPRHGLGAVALGDRIHVLGGARQPGGQDRSPVNEVLTIG